MPRIPWTTIVTHGPAIVAAARQLLATARTSNKDATAIETRLQQLEKASMDSARLLEDIGQQIHALTIVHDQAVRRVRVAIAIGVAALILGIAGIIVALAW